MERFQKISKKVSDKVKLSNKVLLAGSALVVTTTNSWGAITAPTLDTADATTVAVAVLGGLAVIWGIKKAIGLLR